MGKFYSTIENRSRFLDFYLHDGKFKFTLWCLIILVAIASLFASKAVAIELVVSPTGNQLAFSRLSHQPISADGRFVTYESESELASTNPNVFVRDRETDEVTLVSVATTGGPGNYWSAYPTISGDGRYLVFYSHATNLVEDDTNAEEDVFLYDRISDTTKRVNVDDTGKQANGAIYGSPGISSNGRYIVYSSTSDNLVVGDTNNYADTFVYDIENETTRRVSIATGGTQVNGNSYSAKISDDGRYVTFFSSASNLLEVDATIGLEPLPINSLYLHDVQTGITELTQSLHKF